jgi:hypothetical protein
VRKYDDVRKYEDVRKCDGRRKDEGVRNCDSVRIPLSVSLHPYTVTHNSVDVYWYTLRVWKNIGVCFAEILGRSCSKTISEHKRQWGGARRCEELEGDVKGHREASGGVSCQLRYVKRCWGMLRNIVQKFPGDFVGRLYLSKTRQESPSEPPISPALHGDREKMYVFGTCNKGINNIPKGVDISSSSMLRERAQSIVRCPLIFPANAHEYIWNMPNLLTPR